MKFSVGDIVETIDDALKGKVLAINNTTITVFMEDGFEMNFSPSELIVVQDNWLNKVSANEVEKKITDEASNKKYKPQIQKRKREKVQPPMEVDLHIGKLVASTTNMSNHDMLTLQIETAKRKLEFAIRNRIPKLVFIHGVGEGVLKLELEYLLGRYNVSYYDADYKKYGLGATEVYVYQNP
jgi:dsDNA-specific endonuclease/ATPase MutS2